MEIVCKHRWEYFLGISHLLLQDTVGLIWPVNNNNNTMVLRGIIHVVATL